MYILYSIQFPWYFVWKKIKKWAMCHHLTRSKNNVLYRYMYLKHLNLLKRKFGWFEWYWNNQMFLSWEIGISHGQFELFGKTIRLLWIKLVINLKCILNNKFTFPRIEWKLLHLKRITWYDICNSVFKSLPSMASPLYYIFLLYCFHTNFNLYLLL